MKKNVIKFTAASAILALSLTMLAGCGKKNKGENTEAPQSVCFINPIDEMNSPTDVELETREGMVRSDLTGEWIDEKLATKRPLCVMINNIIDAMPQSGISQADITYEFLVEGGITRLMCVFEDFETGIEKLGPVRSSRHYYAQTARVLDGLYAHYGWSTVAEEYIKGIPDYTNLNGLELEGTMYYRDSSRVAPHNVYTDSEKIMLGIDKKGYSLDHKAEYNYKAFKFNKDDTKLNSGNTANKVTTEFNQYRKPWFEYNEAEGRYYRFQYDEPQIDANNNQQLSYKNVIVMLCEYEHVGDTILLNVIWDFDGASGNGYYISDGEYIPITWTRTSSEGVIYKTMDGQQLLMNPGNTFIAVLNSSASDSKVVFE